MYYLLKRLHGSSFPNQKWRLLIKLKFFHNFIAWQYVYQVLYLVGS